MDETLNAPATPATDAPAANAPATDAPATQATDSPAAETPGAPAPEAPETPAGAPETPSPAEAPDPENSPVSDWNTVDLGIGDALDKSVADAFGPVAQQIGLTPAQMKALAKWQVDFMNEARAARDAEGAAILKKEWGRQAAQNQRDILAMIGRVDAELHKANPKLSDASFSAAINRLGGGDADFFRGLAHIAKMIGEDALAASHGDASTTRQETPYEALKELFD